MKIHSKDFRVPEGEAVSLKKWPTDVEPLYKSKKHYRRTSGGARQVFSFTHPARRTAARFPLAYNPDLPERGRIGIFNRSYYEEVLIARVHPEIPRSEGST